MLLQLLLMLTPWTPLKHLKRIFVVWLSGDMFAVKQNVCLGMMNFNWVFDASGLGKWPWYVDPSIWFSRKKTCWIKYHKEHFIWGGRSAYGHLFAELIIGFLNLSLHFAVVGYSWWHLCPACEITLFARYPSCCGNVHVHCIKFLIIYMKLIFMITYTLVMIHNSVNLIKFLYAWGIRLVVFILVYFPKFNMILASLVRWTTSSIAFFRSSQSILSLTSTMHRLEFVILVS